MQKIAAISRSGLATRPPACVRPDAHPDPAQEAPAVPRLGCPQLLLLFVPSVHPDPTQEARGGGVLPRAHDDEDRAGEEGLHAQVRY